MNDSNLVLLWAITLVAAGWLGAFVSWTIMRDDAVSAGVAEYYIDSGNYSKTFRYIKCGCAEEVEDD